jgi:hypothetical protein
MPRVHAISDMGHGCNNRAPSDPAHLVFTDHCEQHSVRHPFPSPSPILAYSIFSSESILAEGEFSFKRSTL